MAAYANAHADNVEASVSTARIVVGAIFGAAVAAEAAPAVLACFADLVCANEAAITIGEIAAGDALGTTTLAIVPAAGTLTLRKGDEIIGFMDQFTGQAKSRGWGSKVHFSECGRHAWNSWEFGSLRYAEVGV
ncbi:hypothetical protein [Pelagibacterium halotolerans]|uniref:hypothetical protein n=1 Tax=Pelagibacterium halotolerans TaxID=531813 RepID=UPI00384E4561